MKEEDYREKLSKHCLISNKSPQNTEAYDIVKRRGLIALIFYMIYVLTIPLVFRYMLYSSEIYDSYSSAYKSVGNGTIDLQTDWTCENCDFLSGTIEKRI